MRYIRLVVIFLFAALAGCETHSDPGNPPPASALAKNHVTQGVNIYLWYATLDTLSFLPLVSADPFGGVVITDWYTSPRNHNEQVKVIAYIQDRDLRADAIKLEVFRQERDGADWQSPQPTPETARKLEIIILTRARELRLETLGI